MTHTATDLGNGPFYGVFSELAALFRLDPPLLQHGHEIEHVIVSELPGGGGYEDEVAVFAASGSGALDGVFYLTHGSVMERVGSGVTIEDTLAIMGYEPTRRLTPVE
jgi:hypothetical protein